MPENQAVLLKTTAVVKPARQARQEYYFFRHGKAALGLFILLSFITLALLAPVLAPGDPLAIVDRPYLKPSAEHLFGTTAQGQDIFAQVVWGARPTLLVAFTIGLTTTLIGAVVGLTAGCCGGTIDKVLSLIVNLFLIIPGLPLMLMLAAFLPPGLATLIFVLTFTGWAWPAHTIRAQILALRENDFVLAAAINAERSSRIGAQPERSRAAAQSKAYSHHTCATCSAVQVSTPLRSTHAVPQPQAGRRARRNALCNVNNLIAPIAASLIGATAYALGASIALEFLGLGNINQASWGMLFFWAHNTAALLAGAWWTFVPAGLCTTLLAFALALLYYALNDLTHSRWHAASEASHAVQKLYNKNQHATPVVRNARK